MTRIGRHALGLCYFIFAFTVLPLQQSIALESGSTTLVDAVEAANWQTVNKLLSVDVDINQSQSDGMTALHWAAFHGNEKVSQQLIDGGAEVGSETKYQMTPLAIACRAGHSAITKLLLNANAEADQEIPGGITPLMLAARVGDADSIRLLLRHGANINEGERKRQTPLMWAAAAGNSEAIEALLDGKPDLNKTTRSGFTAMMFAVREGHTPVVKRLLNAGVDINATMQPQNSGGRVPRKGTAAIHMAVESGHFELAMYLIESGANPNDQRCGFAPLHILTWVRKPNRGEGTDGDPSPRGSGNLTSTQFAQAIIAAGADVNLQLKNGKSGKAVLSRKGATPLLLAGKTADLELIKILVEHGADPLLPNHDGCTPLMACAGVGVRAVGEEAGTEPEVIETLKYLLSLGADVNTVDKNKETAMHGAAYRCFPTVIEFLAANGANPKSWDHKNRSGWTPIRIGQGYRPGSFKPSPPTVAALEAAKTNFKRLEK